MKLDLKNYKDSYPKCFKIYQYNTANFFQIIIRIFKSNCIEINLFEIKIAKILKDTDLGKICDEFMNEIDALNKNYENDLEQILDNYEYQINDKLDHKFIEFNGKPQQQNINQSESKLEMFERTI